MRKGLVAHGALLAVALLAAYQTWTRDKTIKPKLGDVTLMSMAVDSIDLITLQQDLKQVKVERRADATGSYLWATVIRTPPPPKVPEMPEDAVSSPDAPPAIQPSTREFPVGKDGSTWLEKVAPLRALRDLGTPVKVAHCSRCRIVDN